MGGLSMTEMNNKASFVEGPFVLNLRTPATLDVPEIVGRIVAAGPEGSSLGFRQAIKTISGLPEGLSFQELFYEASEILNSYNLYRVE